VLYFLNNSNIKRKKESSMDFVRYSISRFSGAPGQNRLQLGTLLLRLSLVFVLFFTLNTQAAFSQDGIPQSPTAPLPAWDLKTVDATPYFANLTSRALAFKSSNQPCAAYGGDGLYYTCYISPTGWTPATIIDPSRGVGEYASLTYYDDLFWLETRPAITYYDSLNGRLKLAYTLGGVWQVMTVPTLIPPYSVSAGQDEGLTNAATLQKKQQLWKGLLPGEKQPDGASPGVGKYSSIDIDHLGGFHISYYDEFDDTLMYMYSNNPSNLSSWISNVVDDYHDQGDAGLWSSIQVDPNLGVHIAYMSEKYDDLKYAYKNPSGSWKEVTVDSANTVGSMGSLALSAESENGVIHYIPHISYLDFELGNLKYARLINLAANQWFRKVIDSSDVTGWWTSIAVDGSGKAHISYYNATKGDLKYATGKENNWSVSSAQKTGIIGWYTSIALNPANGIPAILYYNATTGWLQYTAKTGSRGGWSIPQNVGVNSSASRDVGRRSSLALNGVGVPFISYLDQSSGLLKYARAYGTSFSKTYPYTVYHSGLFSSIKVVNNYFPRMAFYDSDNGDLRYGAYNGISWVFKWVDRHNDVGQYASLQIGSNGIPQISYYDATSKNLKYARWNNITDMQWITDTVDYVGDVGTYTSLALNSANMPYISYYNESSHQLKLAYYTSAWVITTVDEGDVPFYEDVGRYTSIALDSLGYPHISYYDFTDGDLMYSYWPGPGLPTSPVGWVKNHLAHVGSDAEYISSLKIFSDNTRHLCYLDHTGENGKLMYLHYSGGPNWDAPQTVDGTYDVGYDCSIDLTSAGQPAITYYDRTGGDLKIALSYPLPPPILTYLFLPFISIQP
jgi:hypothetical protein